MHLIDLIHKFHNLSWFTEINELFHDVLIYWDAPVYENSSKLLTKFQKQNYLKLKWTQEIQQKYNRQIHKTIKSYLQIDYIKITKDMKLIQIDVLNIVS